MTKPLSVDSTWTPAARDVVLKACEHYGGLERWRRLRWVRLLPGRLSGLVPWLKGLGRTFAFNGPFEIAPSEGRARFLVYPDEAHVGVFENGCVRLERADSGRVVLESRNHRQSFSGLKKYRRWAPLDALYFFAYALTHYHALPFTLLQARLISHTRRREGEDVLAVAFPSDVPTHNSRQRFYIDRVGRIVRHDYHAEVVGFWARGAHFWERETVCQGFPVSLERHVYARLGTASLPITALHATFVGAEVEFAP